MADRRFSKRLKGKVMSTCVTSPCLYGTETLAMTELQQQRLQLASVRKLLGTKNCKSNDGRHEKNGGVNGRDRSAKEIDRETGEEHTTMDRTCRKDGG